MMGSKEELSEDPNFFHYGRIFQILAKLEAVLTHDSLTDFFKSLLKFASLIKIKGSLPHPKIPDIVSLKIGEKKPADGLLG